MCVWLGTLASWRPGFIGRLVREYRSAGALLERPPAEIVAFASRRRSAREDAGASAGGLVVEAVVRAALRRRPSEAQRFAAVLRDGPEACLRGAERRPPGDLVVAWSDALYPDQLRDLDDPPLCLFVRGGADCQAAARAGSRRSSTLRWWPWSARAHRRRTGRRWRGSLGGDLARAGVVVVSGLAMGIDAVAQTAAVGRRRRRCARVTVAVLGCGADVVYPRQNAAAVRATSRRGGLVVSEFAWGVPARAWRFPGAQPGHGRAGPRRRARRRRGAQRRQDHRGLRRSTWAGRCCACPARRGGRLSAAPNLLLRDGARVCESAADVLKAIVACRLPAGAAEPRAPASQRTSSRRSSSTTEAAPSATSCTPSVRRALTVDELARRCRLPAAKVAAAVSELEVEGLARRVEGGRYRLSG